MCFWLYCESLVLSYSEFGQPRVTKRIETTACSQTRPCAQGTDQGVLWTRTTGETHYSTYSNVKVHILLFTNCPCFRIRRQRVSRKPALKRHWDCSVVITVDWLFELSVRDKPHPLRWIQFLVMTIFHICHICVRL